MTLEELNEKYKCQFRRGYSERGCGCGGKPKRIDTTSIKCQLYGQDKRIDLCISCWTDKYQHKEITNGN